METGIETQTGNHADPMPHGVESFDGLLCGADLLSITSGVVLPPDLPILAWDRDCDLLAASRWHPVVILAISDAYER